jgi:phage portal protein BeeE
LSWSSSQMIFGRRDATPTPVRMIGFPSDGGLVTSGVTSLTALGLSSVWRSLDILSNGISQLDWSERRGNLELPPSRLVTRPQAQRTRREWTSLVVSTLALWDVCYLWKVGGYDYEGTPMALWPLDPTIVMPAYTDLYNFLPPQEFFIQQMRVSRDELVILHPSPQPTVQDALSGVLRIARITFAAAIAAEGYASRYWQSGGSPTTTLETDAKLIGDAPQQIQERWRESRQRGPDYAAVLDNGIKAHPFGADPTTESAVEARRELVADVGRYFGIPTRILNAPTGDSETYHTSEAGNQDLLRYTLQNYADAIQDAISDQLPGSRNMLMEVEPLTRGVQLNRYQAYSFATGGKAWLTPEDVRDMEGLPPVENPNDLLPTPGSQAPVIAAGGTRNG